MLIQTRNDIHQTDAVSINQSRVEKKLAKTSERKGEQPNNGENDGVTQSMSELSISQPKRRKKKAIVLSTSDANAPSNDTRSVVEDDSSSQSADQVTEGETLYLETT
jgi:hypothetical protein